MAALVNSKMHDSVCIPANCMHAHNGVGLVCVRLHACPRQICKIRPGGRYLCEAGHSQIA